jgi:DNA topoisomerase II
VGSVNFNFKNEIFFNKKIKINMANKTITYTVKNDIQHVLDCSDVYIGDVESVQRKDYIFDDVTQKIVLQTISTPEALVRIFVEVLTNAVDNAERSKDSLKCKVVKVNVNLETGLTRVWNDGQFIPIVKNKDHNVKGKGILQSELLNDEDKKTFERLNNLYIHTLIFGHFRSSSNYDNENSLLSGKNGVGVKCTNIFSKFFSVTGIDHEKQLKFYQEWKNNMTTVTEPKVTECSTVSGSTEIRYIPDFQRFKMTTYPKEIMGIFKKLVIDASSLLPQTNFYFNGEKIPVKNLQSYAELYYNEIPKDVLTIKYENSEVVIVGSEVPHSSVSFVNGQITGGGGQHVLSWTRTVFASLLEALNKNKKNIKLTKVDIAPYFQFFIHSRVNKPKFDGQNKNTLKTPKVDSSIEKSQINKILKWNVITLIKNKILRSKELLALKKIEGPRRKIVNIDGYDQANNLGMDSILIVCEGLSAKSYAVSGIQTGVLGKKGRNHFGILPLRGKFLNVKNVNISKITSNKVVSDLIKVLGLKFGVDYSQPQNFKTLNYGTLLILTDADKDGIHIEGLLINFFAELFPSLIKRKGFIVSMKTPIVKVFTKKAEEDLLFYDENTFEEYRKNHPQIKNFKYFKGLGTIGPKDTPLFFGKKLVKYEYDLKSEVSINKVFKDENANERKAWLNLYDPKVSKFSLDIFTSNIIDINVSDFVENEMIKFSYEDCKRSLASCIDGLKESQRKVIYAIRKKFKSLKKSDFIKVAQLSGYVAEQTDYKHGEQNLCETIVKFAQTFVGTNNIPLLVPDGQFGTRLEGGKDSANSRYIYTRPQEILKYIFREEDDPILEHTSEGEPVTFFPIIPMVLINGCVGIGTGWSCSIPQYNPKEIVDHLYKKLKEECDEVEERLDIDPFYKNFKGKIKPLDDTKTKYKSFGRMKYITDDVINVTELPIGVWTDKFKEHCYSLIEKGLMTKLVNESTIENVNFSIYGLEDPSYLKMTTTIYTTNMVLFNHKNIITKYERVGDIFKEFYISRLNCYELRRQHQLKVLRYQITLNENKLKFIHIVIDDEKFLKQEDETIIRYLEEEEFLKVDKSFNYLLNIPIRSCTLTSVKCLENTIITLKKEFVELMEKTASQIWLKELGELEPYLSN